MSDKKVYKMLQKWFPELKERGIPDKKQRSNFEALIEWMAAEKSGNRYRGYLMKFDAEFYCENGLENCAMLQDMRVETSAVQTQIRQRVKPLLEHFEKYKNVIGKYYSLVDQIHDIVFEEIYNALKAHHLEMLLIYADSHYWLAVPQDDEKIEKFCKYFSKQFGNQDVSIEHYALLDCSRSI